ncbi:MAG: ATP-binding protein [Bacteroidales bacterium]|nr:ATP-binding protein [Bacteroidales bacterium]
MRRYSNPLSRNLVLSLVVVSALFVAGFLWLSAADFLQGSWRFVVLVTAMVVAIFLILSYFVGQINRVIGDQADVENAEIRRDLTQNIAHELKTPVASIQGYLETILETPDMDEETRNQFLERSFTQTRRLTALLQDISTLNKMDAKSPAYKIESVDICKMVETIAADTALQRDAAQMTFRNQLFPPIVIKGDYTMVYSIFRNLMDNAIAYAGVGTTVTLTAARDEDSWRFVFRDNGAGVPEAHLERLFERFYRVDKGRSRKLGGTGLGLAIVKNAVLIHGGDITVRNNDTGGLRFDFTLKVNNFETGKTAPGHKRFKKQI